MVAFILAFAQYALKAPTALPAVGITHCSIPSSFAFEIATLKPLVLNEPVGFTPSSFK
jgi:hypothetical protein